MRHVWRELRVIGLIVLALAAGSSEAGAQLKLAPVAQSVALEIPVNKSQVIETDRNFADLSLGNPEIADVVPLSRRSVYVFGKSLGNTSLTLSDAEGRVMAVVDVAVTHDIQGLKARLFELMPDEDIEIRAANNGLVLSGQVSNTARQANILAVAQRFAPDAVTSLLSVRGNQQVMLAVRFAEMQRNLVKELGFTNDLNVNFGDSSVGLFSGQLSENAFASPIVSILSGDFSLTSIIDVLEDKGVVKTLAEPNLIALSGDTASFLAGGEFPVPIGREVEDGGVTVTIAFKEFGVSLSFTPTVLDDQLINLQLFTEVSEIDEASSVVIDNFRIPGLNVRRAKTTVELGNAQSFAIAGLLREDFRDSVTQFPVLGDIPVLGALLRSSQFRTGQTELVVIVTPYLVKPSTVAKLRTPDQNFVPPSEGELFLLGRTEGSASALERGGELARGQAAGIVGAHGYILQ